jgi:PAS domain S-box-containing protein
MEKSTLKAEQSAGETRSREDRSASGDARNGTPPEGLVAPAPPGSVAAPENSGIEALRNSEERQRFSLEAAGIGVWDMDLVTHRTWNSALHDRIFGYKTPQTDWTFERFISHVHPQDRVRIAALYEKAIRSGGGLDFECRIQRADGTLRWRAGHGRLMHDPQGNPVRMHGTVSDISDQVRMKESLQQQTGLFQMVLNSMSEGVIACNEKGDLILINKSARQSLALDDDITTLAHLSASYEWLMPDGVNPCPTEQQPLYRALAGERLTDFESIVRNTRRNVNLAINSSSAPLTNGGGNIVGALNIFRDVTESRRARHELRSAEQHFRLLVEGTTDYAIFMLDASGFVVSWNPGAQRILGYEEHEAVGRHMSLFYTAEDIRRGEPQRKLAQTRKMRGACARMGSAFGRPGCWTRCMTKAARCAASWKSCATTRSAGWRRKTPSSLPTMTRSPACRIGPASWNGWTKH